MSPAILARKRCVEAADSDGQCVPQDSGGLQSCSTPVKYPLLARGLPAEHGLWYDQMALERRARRLDSTHDVGDGGRHVGTEPKDG